jgi:extracellular factor (EF) 3-hydroxypalmitic acid methyl ester biosynthesis protein
MTLRLVNRSRDADASRYWWVGAMRKTMSSELWQSAAGGLRCSAAPNNDDEACFSRRSVELQLGQALHQLRALVHDANETVRQNSDLVSDDVARKVLGGFLQFYGLLESTIGDASPVDEETKQNLGLLVQQDLLPYILLTETGERWISKPRGFAGDYWTIELIYRNQPSGWSRLGRLLDRCFLDIPPAAAVRNRRLLMSDQIRMTVEGNTGHTVRVTSLACGPAQEVFDAIHGLGAPVPLRVSLVDFDYQALAFVAAKRDTLRLGRVISLVDANLVDVAVGRAPMPVEAQDLVYTIGLIDYFNDELVVKLLNVIHGMLRPGGRVIVGNFHPRNPLKAFMDRVLEWKLQHRTEQDVDRLFSRSSFRRGSTTVFYEPQRINMFAECIKG